MVFMPQQRVQSESLHRGNLYLTVQGLAKAPRCSVLLDLDGDFSGDGNGIGTTVPSLTLAQLQAYLTDQGLVAADQTKLTSDQATEGSDAATIAAGLVTSVGILSADQTTVYVFTLSSSSPSGFTVQPITLVTS